MIKRILVFFVVILAFPVFINTTIFSQFKIRLGAPSKQLSETQKAEAVRSTYPYITVVYPNGGETLKAGENYKIKWNDKNIKGNYLIELINKNTGEKLLNIVALSRFWSSYTWKIPKNIKPNDGYAIKINKGSFSDTSDGTFSIGGALISNYFLNDKDALDIAIDKITTTMPLDTNFKERDIRWRVFNALTMLGYEQNGIPWGLVIDKTAIIDIDKKLSKMEKRIFSQSQKIPSYKEHSGPDFKNNIPQDFAAYMFATIFDLFNSGNKKYYNYTTECLFASLVPASCGPLVNSDTEIGFKCRSYDVVKKFPPIIQTPELFGFGNRRDTIKADEFPSQTTLSTYNYASAMVHEFIHDIDKRRDSIVAIPIGVPPDKNTKFLRQDFCGTEFIDFTNSPFVFNGMPGTQDFKDFVSGYASGLSQLNKTYFDQEDEAESITAYILIPEYFRYRMQFSDALKAKYNFIKDNIFSGTEFQNPHLKDYKDFKFTEGSTGEFAQTNKLKQFVISDIFKK